MKLTFSSASFCILTLSLLLSIDAKLHHRRSLSTSSRTKAAHLLHCLGHAAPHKADRAKVEGLIAANPNVSDDSVWRRLTPKEWGLNGHDQPGSNTWYPSDAKAKTRVTKQHDKLINCAKKLQIDVMHDLSQVHSVTEPAEVDARPPDKSMRDAVGGQGFKQVRQQQSLSLRGTESLGQSDSQSVATGPKAAGSDGTKADLAGAGGGAGAVAGGGLTPPIPAPGSAAPAAAALAVPAGADVDSGAQPAVPASSAGDAHTNDPVTLISGSETAPNDPAGVNGASPKAGQPLPGVNATQPAPGTGIRVDAPDVPTAADDQRSDPAAVLPPAVPGQKPAPGLGPDTPSVAPALVHDPRALNMPKTLPGTTTEDGTDPAQQAAVVAGQRALPGASVQNATLTAVDAGGGANLTNGTTQLGDLPLRRGARELALTSNTTDPLNPNNATLASSNCTEPLIRKEYSSLTRDEKKAFIDAIKCVRGKPSRFHTDEPGWNAADDWTLLHIRMVKYVHFTAYFTVFHRGFLAVVQRDLNECGFAGGLPWVDWTRSATDPSTNRIFDADPTFGLGTNGKGDNTECPWQTGLAVVDGALANHYFNAPFRHRLCRQFNDLDVNTPNPHFGNNCTTFINANFVRGLGATHDDGKFFDFSSALEISTHLSMHTCVGGNLAWLSSSPNDMVFHAHHGCVDNIFDGWQKKSDKNRVAFHGPKLQQKGGAHPAWTAKDTDVINFEPLAENVMVKDLLDHESGKWSGRMCYRYDYNVKM